MKFDPCVLAYYFNFLNVFKFFSECEEASDCPNNGENYNCIEKVCDCAPKHVLDGDMCVGMLPNLYFKITLSESLCKTLNNYSGVWNECNFGNIC